MYGVNVKMTGSGSFCACGWNTVALSATPSRIGIFTPQRISGIDAAAAPLSCARLRAAGMLMLSAATRIIRCQTLFRFIQPPPPEHRPFHWVTYLRAHAWYRVREGNPTRRNKCFCAVMDLRFRTALLQGPPQLACEFSAAVLFSGSLPTLRSGSP